MITERTSQQPVKRASAIAAPKATTAPPTRRRRLEGVDGLRAFAALWVVGFHIHAFSHVRFPAWTGIDLFLRSGSAGVSLFLVLSGFCLYLPFAGGRNDRFRTGAFLKRRMARLMPAYYVGLAGSTLLAAVAAAGGLTPPGWQDIGSSLVAHLLLLQTLWPSTFYLLNGAYWSLGLEWQLYLSLPLLIFGARRFGMTRTVVAVVLLNVAYRLGLWALDGHVLPHGSPLLEYVLPNQLPGRWAEFAFGMVAAEAYQTGRLGTSRLPNVVWLALVVLVPSSILLAGTQLSHIVFGSVFVLVLALTLTPGNFLHWIFSRPPMVAVGLMSYSLYLVHQPLVEYGAGLLLGHGATHRQAFFELIISFPVILAIAWILFVTVERKSIGAGVSSGRPLLDRLLRLNQPA